MSSVRQFEESSETRKNRPFRKAVSWKCPIRVFEWSTGVNHGYIKDSEFSFFSFKISTYVRFFFFNKLHVIFCRKTKDLVTIISTRLRMFRFARFILAIIATSASSRSIPLCKGSLATCSLVKNPRGPLPKPSGIISLYMYSN